jgi:hypothetical protein
MVDIIGMIEQKNDGVLRRKVWNLLGDVKKDDHIQQCKDITGIIEFGFYSRSSQYPCLF